MLTYLTETTTLRNGTIVMTFRFSDGTSYKVFSKRQGWGNYKDTVRFYPAGDTEGRWSSMKELDEAAEKATKESRA